MAIGKPAWTIQKWREKFLTEPKVTKKMWIYVEIRNRATHDFTLEPLIEEFRAEVETLFRSDNVLREQYWKADFGQTLWIDEYYTDSEKEHADSWARYFRRTNGFPNSTPVDLNYVDNTACSRPCGGCNTLLPMPPPYFPPMMPHRDADGNFDFMAVCENMAKRNGMKPTEIRDGFLKGKSLREIPEKFKVYIAPDYFKIGSCVTPTIVRDWHRKEANWITP